MVVIIILYPLKEPKAAETSVVIETTRFFLICFSNDSLCPSLLVSSYHFSVMCKAPTTVKFLQLTCHFSLFNMRTNCS